MVEDNPKRWRFACATFVHYHATSAATLQLRWIFTLFPEGWSCYVSRLPWLKIIPTQGKDNTKNMLLLPKSTITDKTVERQQEYTWLALTVKARACPFAFQLKNYFFSFFISFLLSFPLLNKPVTFCWCTHIDTLLPCWKDRQTQTDRRRYTRRQTQKSGKTVTDLSLKTDTNISEKTDADILEDGHRKGGRQSQI